MRTYFIMKKICSFFLLKAQKPLSSTIITDIDKLSGMFYVCIETKTEQQIESFVHSLSDIGIALYNSEVGEAGSKCYHYESHMIAKPNKPKDV